MGTHKLGLVLLFAVLVAAGAWFALDTGMSEGLGGVIAADGGLRPTIDDLPLRAPEAETESGEREGDPEREMLVGESDEEVGGQEAAPDEEAPLLIGRVLDTGGRPVPGARVWAVTGTSWVLAPLDIEEGGLSNWLEPETALADGEGRFAFAEGLEPGAMRLAVRAAGSGPLYLEGRQLSKQRPHDVGDLSLPSGVRLEGRVVDRRGTGVEGALILQAVERGMAGMRISMPGRGVPLARTAAEGRFVLDSIADGPWSLMVDAEGFQVFEEDGRTEAAGEVLSGLLFVLERGEAIHGTIRGLPAGLNEGLRIEARPKSSGGNRDSGGENPQEGASRRVRRSGVDAAGAFRIDGLKPAAEYTLTAWELEQQEGVDGEGSGEWKRHSSIEPAAAWPGGRVEMEYAPEASIVFRVLDAASGDAVETFVVWAGLRDRLRTQPGAGEGDSVPRHHPGGRGSFEGLRPGREGARAKLLIRAAGYKDLERANIDVARGAVVDLGDLALERAPMVRVTVLDDATGEPVEGAHALLAKEGDDSITWFLNSPEREAWGNRELRFGVTDTLGRAALPLIDGEWAKLYVVSSAHVASKPIDVPARSTEDVEHTVRLARGGTVIVTVLSPDGRPLADSKIAHRADDSPAQPVRNNWSNQAEGTPTDPEGVARFEHLEPGSHSFRLMSDGEGAGGVIFDNNRSQDDDEDWRTVRVVEEGTEEIQFVGTARGDVIGVVTEARVGLAGASLNLRSKSETTPRFFFGGTNKYQALSEYDGRFAFRDLAAGEYTLVVTHAERRMPYRQDVTVGPGENVLDVELPLAIIEGRVVDLEGTPIPGLDIRVGTMQRSRDRYGGFGGGSITLVEDDQGGVRPDWRSSRVRNVRTAADGSYTVRGVTAGEPLRVSVSGTYVVSGAVEDLVVAPDEIKGGVDFVLERAGRIDVRLVGAGRRQHNVEARMTRGEQKLTRSTRVWGTRRARLASCVEGTWEIKVKRRIENKWTVVATATAEVRVGESVPITIEVPQ